MSKVEEPVTRVNDNRNDDTITTHPSFAQLASYRVTAGGNGTALYGSDFSHNSFIAIEISASELHRGLNRDWHHSKNNLVRIHLSESQWATFVSSVGQGGGVPCTMTSFNGKDIADLPPPVTRKNQYKQELSEDINNIIEKMALITANVDGTTLSKAKKQEINNGLAEIKRFLVSTFPYMQQSFDKHMESTIEKAKQEIHGFMNVMLQRAGMNAIKNDPFFMVADETKGSGSPTPDEEIADEYAP